MGPLFRAVLSVALVAAALLSGCLGGADPTTDDDDVLIGGPIDASLLKDGRDLRLELQATDELASPNWTLGQWFGHHVLFPGDDEGFHIDTVVAEDRGDNWYLGTSDETVAIFETAFDIPIVGEISKKDLTTTAFGAPWDWTYVFPLTDGMTWTKDVKTMDFESGEPVVFPGVTFTSAFDGTIETQDGNRPGFEITGTTAEGATILKYDFVPDIGWYAHFWFYNVATEDPEDYIFHVMSMGHGLDWKGTYYSSTGRNVMQHVNGMALIDESGMPANPPFIQPKPYATFRVSDEATHLYGMAFAAAFGGAQVVLLVDPSNNHHEWQAVGMGEAGEEFIWPAVAGEWRVVSPGGGVVAFGVVFVWEVIVTAIQFPPADAEAAA